MSSGQEKLITTLPQFTQCREEAWNRTQGSMHARPMSMAPHQRFLKDVGEGGSLLVKIWPKPSRTRTPRRQPERQEEQQKGLKERRWCFPEKDVQH